MTTLIQVYSRPDSSLASVLASVAQSKSVGWAVARSLVAEACCLSADDLRAVERGEVPSGDVIARLAGASSLVSREAPVQAVGWRAMGSITLAAGDGEAAFRFTMSTDNVDRASDIVDQDWDLGGFARNPVAFYNHATWGMPIGRWANVGGQPLSGDFVPYRPAEPAMHSLAALVADMLDKGHLHACSVGFLPTAVLARAQLPMDDPRYAKQGYVYLRPKLLECSVVGIPMNGDACRPGPAEMPERAPAKSFTTEPGDWFGFTK
jgi:hypothetical protein